MGSVITCVPIFTVVGDWKTWCIYDGYRLLFNIFACVSKQKIVKMNTMWWFFTNCSEGASHYIRSERGANICFYSEYLSEGAPRPCADSLSAFFFI